MTYNLWDELESEDEILYAKRKSFQTDAVIVLRRVLPIYFNFLSFYGHYQLTFYVKKYFLLFDPLRKLQTKIYCRIPSFDISVATDPMCPAV